MELKASHFYMLISVTEVTNVLPAAAGTLKGGIKKNVRCLFYVSVAGCTNSLIKEVHHFRILGENQVRRLLFCRHTPNL